MRVDFLYKKTNLLYFSILPVYSANIILPYIIFANLKLLTLVLLKTKSISRILSERRSLAASMLQGLMASTQFANSSNLNLYSFSSLKWMPALRHF